MHTQFERVAIDLKELFTQSDYGISYVLIVIDHFNNWPKKYPFPKQVEL